MPLKWTLGLAHRAIASALRINAGAVGETASRAKRAELDWERTRPLSDELEERLYGAKPAPSEDSERPLPDFAVVHADRARPRVTLALLHYEYQQVEPGGYGNTQFCEYYRGRLADRNLTMRQEHLAGSKMFVDYSGVKASIVDRESGRRVEVELFVAVLGASNCTYAEATYTQGVADFISSHQRAFEYLGGVPAAVVPDPLKSAVVVASKYEPGLQRT